MNSPRVYEDKITGTSSTRPELEKLIADCRSGKIENFLVWKLDRLDRSLQHRVHVIGELTRLKIPLICTSQGIDTSETNPAGKLQLHVLAAVAEFERELIVERTKSGLERAKASGVKLGRMRLDPKLRAQARALRSKGFSYDAIRIELGISKGKAIEFCS